MMEREFDVDTVSSVNFGVSLRDKRRYFVPIDAAVQSALGQMLRATAKAFDQIEGDWEGYSPSEDYGEPRRLRASRDDDLMLDIGSLYEMEDLADMANVTRHVREIDFYFAVFRDEEGRKLIAVKKAVQFKGTLSARNRLVRITNNSLKLIEDEVLRLDMTFDALVGSSNVYILSVRPVEYMANLVDKVAGAASAKVHLIQRSINFLDLSGLIASIGRHPKTARLAASIAARDDLGLFDQDGIVALAKAQGIKLTVKNGRLKPRKADEHKLLEILDDRRYMSNLTSAGPQPFRATGRQKVKL
jgi:hypothetical protein